MQALGKACCNANQDGKGGDDIIESWTCTLGWDYSMGT